MELAFRRFHFSPNSKRAFVSILVLMELAFRPDIHLTLHKDIMNVSILVLMELAFRPYIIPKKPQKSREFQSLF